jgi:hypothetical protein
MRKTNHNFLRRRWRFMATVVSMTLCMASFAFPAGSTRSSNGIVVDLALVLALDVSGSVDEDEFDLQKNGLALAFRHPEVIEAIRSGRSKRIAVSVVQWAGFKGQHVSVPWTIVGDTSSASGFADRITRLQRRFPEGPTHISGVIEFATRMIRAAPFAAQRHVIDVSGDGVNNVGGGEPTAERDAAVALGITINGLVILNATTNLDQYFRTNVIGGSAAFVVTADDYDDYPRAILLKLLHEIGPRLA